jgi:hypothetical protein
VCFENKQCSQPAHSFLKVIKQKPTEKDQVPFRHTEVVRSTCDDGASTVHVTQRRKWSEGDHECDYVRIMKEGRVLFQGRMRRETEENS